MSSRWISPVPRPKEARDRAWATIRCGTKRYCSKLEEGFDKHVYVHVLWSYCKSRPWYIVNYAMQYEYWRICTYSKSFYDVITALCIHAVEFLSIHVHKRRHVREFEWHTVCCFINQGHDGKWTAVPNAIFHAYHQQIPAVCRLFLLLCCPRSHHKQYPTLHWHTPPHGPVC